MTERNLPLSPEVRCLRCLCWVARNCAPRFE